MSFKQFIPLSCCFVIAAALFGCGSGTQLEIAPPPPPVTTYSGATFSGKALAGTTPIVGATVQLYAAGITGNGSAPTSLGSALTTDSNGAFTVPAGYTCTTAASQLYVVVRGGSVATASNNSAITLATAIGACNGVTASSQFVINEVTTAAAAWSLSQFLAPGANLGSSATNAQGLANAQATLANLANLTAGTSPGAAFPATGTSPAPRINSVANLLHTCTAATSSTACSSLFTATTAPGATAPGNTLDAALSLVRNPGNNIAQLYTLSAATSAFTPALGAAPRDWTLFINYSGGGMNEPTGLGVDSNGNIWVASYVGVVSEFSPTGKPASATGITGNGLHESYGLAIDAQNNIWVPNEESPGANGGLGTITELSSSGQPLSGTTGYTAGAIDFPTAIAIDPNGTAWVVDYGDATVTLLSSTGKPLSGTTGYTSGKFDFPINVAIDANHNGWVANLSDVTVTKVAPDGSSFTNYSCCDGPDGLAIDQKGNVWVANYYGDSISELDSSGNIISNGYTGGGLSHPQSVAIDGTGNVWVANYRGNSITQLAGAASTSPGKILSPAAGWAPDANLLESYAIAIDASGNLWVTSYGNNLLTEFVGLTPPVKTPLLGPPQAP
jgi:hypothetical protein